MSLRLALLAVLLSFSVVPAVSSTFSFTGTFIHDNDVQFFNITLLTGGTITFQTFGYGGGINGAGHTITAGGFEPLLALFDATGTETSGSPIPAGNSPACGPRNIDPARLNTCLDDFGSISLSAGTYTLALTQNPNANNSTNLSDGFFFVDTDPDPNFNNGFVGSTTALPGNGNWAVDIVGADRASIPGAAPEPTPALLSATSLLMLALGIRKVRKV
jgi:hypothetical protein